MVVKEPGYVEENRTQKHEGHGDPGTLEADETTGVEGFADGKVPPYCHVYGQPGTGELWYVQQSFLVDRNDADDDDDGVSSGGGDDDGNNL